MNPFTVTIHVTQEDILRGEKRMCQHCPVALALQRATGTVFRVGEHEATRHDYRAKARLPMALQHWIRAFDNGEPVKPIEATLEFK